MGCFGTRDGGHLDDLAAGDERRQILFCGERAFVDESALQGEGCPHDREHIRGHVAFDIDAEARLNAVIERRLERWHAVSHLHLDGGRDRNLAAGIGNHLPMGLTELSTMDVFIATSGSGQSETNVTTEPWSAVEWIADADLTRASFYWDFGSTLPKSQYEPPFAAEQFHARIAPNNAMTLSRIEWL
jgi:hypothetical protein